MSLRIHPEGWGEVVVENIFQVLNSVHKVFLPCFGQTMNPRALSVAHSDGPPICFKDSALICLSAQDKFWSQYAYQFAHEYCHYQIKGPVPQQLRWFEESLCELASYYFLPKVSALWRTNPPYPNWVSYADEFSKYTKEDAAKATPFNLDFSSDTMTLRQLEKNEYNREKNAYVATALFPVFQESPSLWSAITLIGFIPDGLSFQASLQCWHDKAPTAYRADIKTIARIFSAELS